MFLGRTFTQRDARLKLAQREFRQLDENRGGRVGQELPGLAVRRRGPLDSRQHLFKKGFGHVQRWGQADCAARVKRIARVNPRLVERPERETAAELLREFGFGTE